jgi:VWFA-related protein
MRILRPFVCGVIAPAVVSMAVVVGQEPPPQTSFRSAANYVRVDVYASKNGEAVTDLRQEDFALLEDGVPQTIETFERVQISGTRADPRGREPGSLAESRDMIDNPRARLFVLFLDTLHVDAASSRTIARPLIGMLTELFAPDDMVAVMTPRMRARDVTFGRRTAVVERVLREEWWSEQIGESADATERLYQACYPPRDPTPGKMIARRREELTLNALEDLVLMLRDLREERKAIVTVTSGWSLFRQDQALMDQNPEGILSTAKVGVDPRTGTLTTRDSRSDGTEEMKRDCARDRVRLAGVDHEQRFETLLDEANWANASFYPVDPRGLTPGGGIMDANVLRLLASETDGTAIVNTNSISQALTRITADLSSYYLLGYRSTSEKEDGKFRRISVRSRRPGLDLRARRGYLPANARLGSRATSAAPVPPAAGARPEERAYAAAFGALAGAARDLPLGARAASAPSNGGPATFWVTSEVPSNAEWKAGGEIDVRVLGANGGEVARARAILAPGMRAVTTKLSASAPTGAGTYSFRIQARPTDGGATVSETIALSIADGESSGTLLVRRGPATGNREVPTADPRIRRSEQLRIELPGIDSDVSVRLLDRTGKALGVPLTTAVRTDDDGRPWRTVQIVAAPLSAGEYLVEMTRTAPAGQTLIGVRVVP